MGKKERLDVLLTQQGYFNSREQAKRSIMAGLVKVDQEILDKAGMKVPIDAEITIKGQLHPYVSRGGLKLQRAIEIFHLDLTDKIVIDIGASTGGFTDCSLQNGAKEVYALDVGYGQLAWSLRQDSRVHVMERTNFRYLDKNQLASEPPDFSTIDVSFISLKTILTHLITILLDDGEVVALIKPQFEAGRELVGKKGIVKDPAIHQQVLESVIAFALETGYECLGITYSPIKGGEGNIEFLTYLRKRKHTQNIEELKPIINETVMVAHQDL